MLPPGTFVEGWLVVKEAGRGTQAELMQVRHPDGRLGALKVLRLSAVGDSTALARFEIERTALGEVQHPHLLGLLHWGDLPTGQPWQVLEWVEGETLAARLKRGPLAAREVEPLLAQLAGALDALHERGWVHRDLKLENVLLGPAGVKLSDLGLARRSGEGQRSSQLTTTGHVLGTPVALAPEQIRGDPVTASTDVYALGVLLFQLLTGRPPFAAERLVELEQLHLEAEPPALTQGGRLDAVVRRCLQKNPAARFSSAREVAAAFAAALEAGVRVAIGVRALSAASLPAADAQVALVRRRLHEAGAELELEGQTHLAVLPGPESAARAWVERLRAELSAQSSAAALALDVEWPA